MRAAFMRLCLYQSSCKHSFSNHILRSSLPQYLVSSHVPRNFSSPTSLSPLYRSRFFSTQERPEKDGQEQQRNHERIEDQTEQDQNSEGEIESTRASKWPFIILVSILVAGFIPRQDLQADEEVKVYWCELWYRTVKGWFEKDETLLAPPITRDSFGRVPRTLVMNAKDTLGHPVWDRMVGWSIRKRPHFDELFQRAFYSNYEMVIWDSANSHEMEQHVADLDPLQICRIRLYRDQMNDKGLDSVKDLTRLGRDLNRTIVIDTDPMLCDTPENVIVVSEFVDNLHDEELSRVAKFVEDINRYNIPDVRPYIKLFNENPSGDFVFSDGEWGFVGISFCSSFCTTCRSPRFQSWKSFPSVLY